MSTVSRCESLYPISLHLQQSDKASKADKRESPFDDNQNSRPITAHKVVKALSQLHAPGTLEPLVTPTGRLHPSINQKGILPTESVKESVKGILKHKMSLGMTIAQMIIKERDYSRSQGKPITSMKIVGSLTFKLIVSMLRELYTERMSVEAAEILCQPDILDALSQEPNDWDFQSLAPDATEEELLDRLRTLSGRSDLSLERDTDPAPFSKCIPSRRNGYLLVGIDKIDYCLMGDCGTVKRRTYFSTSTNLQIGIVLDSITEDLERLDITIESVDDKALQAIIDHSARFLEVEKAWELDYRGALVWNSLELKGYIPVQPNEYTYLFSTLLKGRCFLENWNERVVSILKNVAAAHNGKNEETRAALTLQFEISNTQSPLWNRLPNEIQSTFSETCRQGLDTPELVEEPLIALYTTHRMTGDQLLALLQLGALLSLSMPRGCAESKYAIRHECLDDKIYYFYKLKSGHSLVVPYDEQAISRGFGLSSIRDFQPLLLSFFFHCYRLKEIYSDTEITKSEIKILTPHAIQNLNNTLNASDQTGSTFPLMAVIMAIALSAHDDKEAEEQLMATLLPNLLRQPLLANWAAMVALPWLQQRQGRHRDKDVHEELPHLLQIAPQDFHQERMAEMLARSWEDVMNTLLCRDDHVVLRELHLLLALVEALSLTLEMAPLIAFTKAVHQNQSEKSYRLLPLWSRSLAQSGAIAIDNDIAGSLLEACGQSLKQKQTKPVYELCSHPEFIATWIKNGCPKDIWRSLQRISNNKLLEPLWNLLIRSLIDEHPTIAWEVARDKIIGTSFVIEHLEEWKELLLMFGDTFLGLQESLAGTKKWKAFLPAWRNAAEAVGFNVMKTDYAHFYEKSTAIPQKKKQEKKEIVKKTNESTPLLPTLRSVPVINNEIHPPHRANTTHLPRNLRHKCSLKRVKTNGEAASWNDIAKMPMALKIAGIAFLTSYVNIFALSMIPLLQQRSPSFPGFVYRCSDGYNIMMTAIRCSGTGGVMFKGPIAEGMLFRLLLQELLLRQLPKRLLILGRRGGHVIVDHRVVVVARVVFTTTLFVMAHTCESSRYPDICTTGRIFTCFVLGLLEATVMEKIHNVAYAILFHAVWNFVPLLISSMLVARR